VPEAFSAEQPWQEQLPSVLLPAASSQYCHPEHFAQESGREGLSLPPRLGVCLCTRNVAEKCLFVPQKYGGP